MKAVVFYPPLKELIAVVPSYNVHNFLQGYIELKTKTLERKKLPSGNTVVDLTPIYEELQEAISQLANWQRHFWMSELKRYMRQ